MNAGEKPLVQPGLTRVFMAANGGVEPSTNPLAARGICIEKQLLFAVKLNCVIV